jgi:hypothetical protein
MTESRTVKPPIKPQVATFEVDSNGEEHVLYAGGKIKGRCRVCGVWGHKSATCQQKKGNNSGRGFGNSDAGTGSTSSGNSNGNGMGIKKFTGVCHYCKKVGHREKQCCKRMKHLTMVMRRQK